MTAALVQPTGAAHTRIYAYGAARGENSVPNEDLIGPIDSSDEWIRQRTGIQQRHYAPEGVGCSDLAVEASQRALASSASMRAT